MRQFLQRVPAGVAGDRILMRSANNLFKLTPRVGGCLPSDQGPL
jgi:hypothetical protein